MKDNKSLELKISQYIGKLIRENFGKGPQSIYVSYGNKFITVYLKGFLSPFEKFLKDNDDKKTLEKVRTKIFDSLLSKIKISVEIITNNTIKEFYYDWCLDNKSAIFVMTCVDVFKNEGHFTEDYKGKDVLEDSIVELSSKIQKAPEHIESYQLNSRTIIVIREKILINIEKELIRQGYVHILKIIKGELEKKYLDREIDFQKILEREVVDCFVDWDFTVDKSAIVLIMKES